MEKLTTNDKDKESSYFPYRDVDNLYGWSMSKKWPVKKFKWDKYISKFDECFRKGYNEENDKGYFLDVDFQYAKKLHELHNDFPYLSDRMKIEKVEKLLANLHDKTEYVMHTRNFKEALNHG